MYDSLSSKTDGNRVSAENATSHIIHGSLSDPDTMPSVHSIESGSTSDYAFSGSISEQVLHNYLDKAITMQGLCNWYDPSLEYVRMQDINMIIDVGAKFVGRAAWFWGGASDGMLDYMCSKLQLAITTVHAIDPDVIFQAGVFEFVDTTCRDVLFPIDPAFLDLFGIHHDLSNHIVSPGQDKTKFDNIQMLYTNSNPAACVYEDWHTTPDITQLETRMWFYYLATRYIDVGCEAIHFGDIFTMDRLDGTTASGSFYGPVNGHHLYWDLLSKVRAYAATKNRGLVLCDAHCFADPINDIYGYYYDPTSILPNWARQLLFDFHSDGTAYRRNTSFCNDMTQPVVLTYGSGLLNNSWGGLNPQGWLCVHNPVLLEFDNGASNDATGCFAPPPAGGIDCYGWDDISWFGSQPEEYRNIVLIYTYYAIKCYDAYSHFQMTGLRYLSKARNNEMGLYIPWGIYHAGNLLPLPPRFYFNQLQTIKDIWNGKFTATTDWVLHNFTI